MTQPLSPKPPPAEQRPPEGARDSTEENEAASVRTVTCAACQQIVRDRDSHLTSGGVLCSGCFADE